MFNLFKRSIPSTALLTSTLYDEETFYTAFLKDLGKCQSEVLIESPFITNRRLCSLLPVLQKLKDRKVRITINTRDPKFTKTRESSLPIEPSTSVNKVSSLA